MVQNLSVYLLFFLNHITVRLCTLHVTCQAQVLKFTFTIANSSTSMAQDEQQSLIAWLSPNKLNLKDALVEED